MIIRVTCIKKLNITEEDPYEAITSFGWISDKHPITVISSKADMCDFVERGVQAYVQGEDNSIAFLKTGVTVKGNRYVKAADDINHDMLLQLPDCP